MAPNPSYILVAAGDGWNKYRTYTLAPEQISTGGTLALVCLCVCVCVCVRVCVRACILVYSHRASETERSQVFFN